MKSAKNAMKYYSHVIPFTSPNPELPFAARFISSAAAALPSNDAVRRNVFSAFRDWIRTGSIDQFDSIFKVLKDPNVDKDHALSQMDFFLSEQFVLQALSYGNKKYDVLSCLKFFDWAGRQAQFAHTQATFHSIFRILSRAKLTRVMLDFLRSYERQRFVSSDSVFRSTLVLGYTLAGQIPIALHLIGKMRFCGLDLNSFCYNILLHVMIDEGFSDAADAIHARLTASNVNNKISNSIVVKSLCRKKRLSDAESYLRDVCSGKDQGYGLGMLVDSLCQVDQFRKACSLIQEFRAVDPAIMAPSYRVWIKNLARVGNVDDALGFLDTVEREESFFPGASTYNFLLFALLKLNRVRDVFHLLMEMQENGIPPNQSTLSAAFCFFCKVGHTDVAVDLNDYALEFGESQNLMAYSYLISALCDEGNTRDAWRLLESLIRRGIHPCRSMFLRLGHALCRQRNLDIMRQIVFLAAQHNLSIVDSISHSFVTELCRCKRAEEAYLLFSDVRNIAGGATYSELIRCLSLLNRGDIASRLLIEMQDNGFAADRFLFFVVISCLFRSENPEIQFLKLLETQIHQHGETVSTFNTFIEGAARWNKVELARHVFEKMILSGIEPNMQTQKVILSNYFKNRELSRGIHYAEDLRREGKLGKHLCHTVANGLCINDRSDLALIFMKEMEGEGIIFKSSCYEWAILNLCRREQYDDVVSIVNELGKNRRITTFIGNTLITNAMQSQRLYEVWTRMRRAHGNDLSCLYDVVRVISSGDDTCVAIEALEQMIGVCFPMNLYSYNMMVKWYGLRGIEGACMAFDRILEKGLRPNKWSFQYVLEGFRRYGDKSMALRWLLDMKKRGLHHNFF